LDSVDKVILVLPLLAGLDVASTLYVQSQGNPSFHEVGLFAGFFAKSGLLYVYIPVYLLMIIGLAYFLWYIRNKELDTSRTVDKFVFLFLVIAACFVYVSLTATFIGNFFLPSIVSRGLDFFTIQMVIYVSTTFSLAFYIWHDVLTWITRGKEEKL
jgi:O-antigen/teichoic acid export membrane protein